MFCPYVYAVIIISYNDINLLDSTVRYRFYSSGPPRTRVTKFFLFPTTVSRLRNRRSRPSHNNWLIYSSWIRNTYAPLTSRPTCCYDNNLLVDNVYKITTANRRKSELVPTHPQRYNYTDDARSDGVNNSDDDLLPSSSPVHAGTARVSAKLIIGLVACCYYSSIY